MASLERFFSLRLLFGLKSSKLIVTLFVLLLQSIGHTQNIVSSPLLRFPVWFVLEESPSLTSPLSQDVSVFSPAAEGIRDLAPFFIEGLVYGWEFIYTPSDIVRGVSEYFEIVSIVSVDANDPNIRFTDSIVTSDASVVESWIEYDLTKRMIYERYRWHVGAFPSVGGIGEASVFDGIESIRIACESAAKNAIRDYARTIEKNKPKEIQGSIFLTDFPRYYIDAGKYVADLDFFLNVSKIVEYTTF